jgi:hypothetical protein
LMPSVEGQQAGKWIVIDSGNIICCAPFPFICKFQIRATNGLILEVHGSLNNLFMYLHLIGVINHVSS